jgi:hypothetical protein
MPGLIARQGSIDIISALIDAGDLATADRTAAAALARCRDAGDMLNLPYLLMLIADLHVQAGRFQDAAAHLREGLQIVLRAGDWWDMTNGVGSCALLCTATGRYAEAATLWAALDVPRRQQGRTGGSPEDAHREEQDLSTIGQALGPARARAAEQRGAAMSLDTAAEYALLLTAPARHRPRRRARHWHGSAPGNGNWSPWSPRAAPTPRSPPSCTSASAPSARTWTGSGTRPAAAAAPT